MEYWLELYRDIVIYIVSIFGYTIYSKKATPNQRGFYCNDDSLSLLYIDRKEWHVTNGILFGVSISVPIVCMVLLEYLSVKDAAKNCNVRTPWHLVGYRIHITLRSWAFTFNLVLGLTEILKQLVGRLRPHFIDVCVPQWDAIECTDITGEEMYISDIPCTATNLLRLKDARKSFPSGHALVSTFAMVYLVIYLHTRNKYLPKPLILLIQTACLSFAAYTSVTRVLDHAHHSTDVLAGVSIGAITAGLSAMFASDLFTNKGVILSEKRKIR